MNSKGQSVLFDFIFAVFLFFLTFGFIAGIWFSNQETVSREESLKEAQFLAFQTTEYLVREEGVPKNWEKGSIDDVERIGLASKDRILDEEKVDKFVEWTNDWNSSATNYNKLKDLLGGYEYNFRISGAEDFNVGKQDVNLSAVVIERIVYYKGVESILEFKVFLQ